VFPALLKGGAMEFETIEGIRFIFHGKENGRFGTVINKGDVIFVPLPQQDLIGAHIRVN
jgi:hypothetical protein